MWPFRTRQKNNRVEEPDDTIKPGQIWIFEPNYLGPWPQERITKVKVQDVKEGWVRYAVLPEGFIFQDERMEEECFRKLYRREV